MIDGLKPYPNCKESGLQWLGEIPKHWEVKRGKSLFNCVDVRSQTGEEELLTVSADRGVVPRSSATVTMFKAESYVGYKLCWPGDLVINSLWAWGRGLGVSKHHGIISTAYGVYRPRDPEAVRGDFIHALVRSTPFNWELTVRSKGIWISRLQLTDQAFLNAPIPLPPPDEQAAIVRFLDHADRRIRRYIRAKRQLIALLNEQKQAIIHRAVTRGLDPNVRLKPSGVEWLGAVPEHWETKKLRGLVDVKGGMTPSKVEPSFWDGEMPWVSPKDMKVAELSDSIDHITSLAVEQTNIQVVRPQAVLIVVRGMILAKTFPVTVTTVPVTINQDMKALVPLPTVDATFLRYALVGATPHIHTLVEESGHGTRVLRTELWRDVVLPVPSLNEQKEIASQIQRELDRVDRAEERYRNEIDLLREYRIRLVGDVVTGKLDVREAAADLPEEAEDTTTDYVLEDEGVADDSELNAEPEEVEA